ncbi:hypothetical protein [Paenibacillus sp. 7541]|uniref:hypothetical protein n=1 Tax=Paenibacillus sp. 7541 TaxID=2026236 RepID=UPI001595A0A9|nr:hypothetical protein [Paenibacillus sp. 7541]
MNRSGPKQNGCDNRITIAGFGREISFVIIRDGRGWKFAKSGKLRLNLRECEFGGRQK